MITLSNIGFLETCRGTRSCVVVKVPSRFVDVMRVLPCEHVFRCKAHGRHTMISESIANNYTFCVGSCVLSATLCYFDHLHSHMHSFRKTWFQQDGRGSYGALVAINFVATNHSALVRQFPFVISCHSKRALIGRAENASSAPVTCFAPTAPTNPYC